MRSFLSLNLSAPPAPPRTETTGHTHWPETRDAFPIYLALAKQLELEIPVAPEDRNLPEKADGELVRQVDAWLNSMDQRVAVYELRRLLQTTTLNSNETGLAALIQRHLRKLSKTTVDRDKIDFLLVQYFALCAPAKIYHKQIEMEDAAEVMKPVLGSVTVPASLPAWCEPLEGIIVTLRGFRSLREILKTNFIEQGRNVKEAAGSMFYEPASLLTFVRFNFLLRRTLIELMHADLIGIRSGLGLLDSAGVQVIDCQKFGLTDSEPIGDIRKIADEWKQPFQQDYTERTVNDTFERLLNLRSDVEQALEHNSLKSGGSLLNGKRAEPQAEVSVPVPEAATPAPPSVASVPDASVMGAAVVGASVPAAKVEAIEALDFESCLEQIWEQLIAAPPSRGRSMTTIKVGTARVLLSSWEVTAFVSEDSPAAEDLRRAVVARALVTAATESAKSSGDASNMNPALSIARIEVSRLQERVDVAKQAKDTEAAVNLGISTKRLLSALDEAERI
jgi:hypothetical protein